MSETRANGDRDTVNEMVAAVVTASRVLVAVSARSLGAVEESLTLPQFRMLVVLENGGPTNLSRLAEQLTVNPSTAMRMIDRLAAAGMVQRTNDPVDRRVAKIALTESGRHVVREVTGRRQAEIAKIIGAMSPVDRGAMIKALQAFAKAAGEPQVDPAEYAAAGLPGWN